MRAPPCTKELLAAQNILLKVKTTTKHLLLSGKGCKIVTLVCGNNIYKGKSATGTSRSVRRGWESLTPFAIDIPCQQLVPNHVLILQAPSYRQQMQTKESPFLVKNVSLEMDCRLPCLF